uniref:3-hydroxyacyl-CoA dehydrogenase NAD binding domain-containing protein n=1 Tax=Aegilops tauschii subsp. strangulata TaxID=200361 RepID=A0A452Y1G4_AEGTS
VILKEINEKFLNAGIGRIKENLQSRVRKGKMTKDNYDKTLSLLTGVLDYEKFKSVDLAIETVVENVKLKQQIFAELEQHCPSHCILATNTSTIDLDLIGEKTNSQDRIVGTHFFASYHASSRDSPHPSCLSASSCHHAGCGEEDQEDTNSGRKLYRLRG